MLFLASWLPWKPNESEQSCFQGMTSSELMEPIKLLPWTSSSTLKTSIEALNELTDVLFEWTGFRHQTAVCVFTYSNLYIWFPSSKVPDGSLWGYKNLKWKGKTTNEMNETANEWGNKNKNFFCSFASYN